MIGEGAGTAKRGLTGSFGSAVRGQGQEGPGPMHGKWRKRRGVRCTWRRGKQGLAADSCTGIGGSQ
jgi:hypothetical protein